MSGVSGRVSLSQRQDAREAIYEPPDRSLWLYMWEFHGWKQDQSVSDLLSCLREDPLTDVAKFSLTEFPHVRHSDRWTNVQLICYTLTDLNGASFARKTGCRDRRKHEL